MIIVNKDIEQYVESHTTPEDKLMKALNRETYLKTYYPNMLSGAVQGKVLEMIGHMIRPHRILEIGTFTGYSAIAMAKGLPEGGKLITIDINEELETFVRNYLETSGLVDKIGFIVGNALEIIPELEETFDLVFIDADKEQYLDYYKLVLPKVRQGGFILADNVFWDGRVLEDDTKSDKETFGVKAFNEFVKNDDRVEQVILSIRDGLMLIRKL
jgi:predicted O-methyltransferase YrrM